MKILFLSDVYFPRINGVSTSIRTFRSELKKLGHSVHLIAPAYNKNDEKEEWITRVPSRKIYFDPEDRLIKYSHAVKLIPWIKKESFDVVHIHTPFFAHYLGLKIKKELNIACVETYHTFFEDYLHHYLPWIPESISRYYAQWISKRQCNAVDAIVSPSMPMLDVLRDYRINTKAEVIPTGLEEHYYKQAKGKDFRKDNNIPDKQKIILFVGRVAHEKNIVFLLKMHRALLKVQPETLLVVTGEGPAENDIKLLSRKLGIENNIRQIGYLDQNQQLPSCYAAADVFVFASKSETQGIVLLEAMAQSTPVVAISELGTASILKEGVGSLIAEDNIEDFANKVNKILSNKVLSKELGKKAFNYAFESWSAKKQAEKLIKFYKKINKVRKPKDLKSNLFSTGDSVI